MKKSYQNLDGFVPRQPNGGGYGQSFGGNGLTTSAESEGLAYAGADPTLNAQPLARDSGEGLTRASIDSKLSGIGDDDPHKRRRRRPISKKRLSKRVGLAILAILVLVLLFVGIRFLIASGNIFRGNVFGLLQAKELAMDDQGRTNVLLVGSTDDDPNHPGNRLTDTIMILSLDQNKKKAAMFSIPRDLWVDYGQACPAGFEGKLNEYFYCSDEGTDAEAEQRRLKRTQQFIGDLVGLELHYGVHVNSVVVRDSVDAVGGVEVDVQGSNGDPGVYDRQFDGACNYTCYKVKYDNGVHQLDGEHAMYLSMARGMGQGSYGLSRANFDREVNQQKIAKAVVKKAASVGTLADIGKVTSLIDALGNNLRTNFEMSEIQTLMNLGQAIPVDDIEQISLVDEESPVVTTGQVGSASIVRPVDGLEDFSGMREYISERLRAALSDETEAEKEEEAEPVVETPVLGVYNGSGATGVAGAAAEKLRQQGYEVAIVDNAPVGQYQAVELYDVTGKNPKSKAALETLYGVKARSSGAPVATNGVDFVVVLGQAR
ncbi:hypothetical protein CR983_01050 [Candidatus Saccharibacteria bacterium]|nr:MAG: hypothetical protein CR983_01050 [Candidatus Saccharibacteria bacterium]